MENENGNGMTEEQLFAFLEMLAKLIEAKAKTVKEAVEIIRSAMPK